MKKILFFLLALCLMAPAVEAQNKTLQKELKKEYKKKMKEYKKGKWALFASTRTLEVALLTHYDKLNSMGEEGFEQVGIASRFKSKSVGSQMALNDACVQYASTAGSTVKGRIISDLAGDGIEVDKEFDHFYAAYERLVEKEIKGEMQKSYSIIREIEDGVYEMQTFFIINESAASKARIRAFENAAKESEAAQRHAEKISEFIKKGFDK